MVCGFTPERRASRNLAPSINEFLIPITDESYTEHQRGPHVLPSELLFRRRNSGLCPGNSCFRQEQGKHV